LRKWEQARPPKPHSGKVDQLLTSLADELSRKGDPWHGTLARHYQFKFAWVMGELLYRLQRQALPNRLLSDIFGTYRQEYLLARRYLGNPMR